MIRLLTLLLGALLASAGVARAQTAAAPADTLPGHARLVRHMSASLCNQLQAYSTAQIQHLSEADAQQLVQQLMTKAMLSDSTALLSMLHQAQQQGREPRQVGEKLGYDATVDLGRQCPAAMPLIVRLGLATPEAKQAAATQANLSAADKQALQPMATALCSQLSAAEAKQPFASLTPAERQSRLTALFQQQFTSRRAQLLRYYKAAQLADEQFMEGLGKKVAYLMLAQPECASYLIQLGADAATKP